MSNKCIFCRIAQKEIPPLGKSIIYEDENTLAWLSPFPNTEAFTIIITKQHYPSDVLDLPDKVIQQLMRAAKNVSEMIIDAYEDVGRVGMIAEGMGINHAHIKLSPMHKTSFLKSGEWKQTSSGEARNEYYKKYPGFISSHDAKKVADKKLQEQQQKILDANK